MKLIALGDNVIDYYHNTQECFPGGNAVNVAVHAARLGAQAEYLGSLGDDNMAHIVKKALRENGVDISHCPVLQGRTTKVCSYDVVNGERSFIEVITGESWTGPLQIGARELDELIQAKKAAEDERDLYEKKLEEQMGAAERLKKDAETAAQEAEARRRELAETQAQIRALQENIRTLESRPVEVAVQVDEGAVAKAREEEKAAAQKELERLEKKLQKAEKAREQAEATAKAAEDKLETAAADVAKERDGLKLELQEARRKLEMSDVTVAQFKIVFDTVQGNLNDMLALIAKASGENQTKLRAAAEKLLEAFGEKVKRNG